MKLGPGSRVQTKEVLKDGGLFDLVCVVSNIGSKYHLGLESPMSWMTNNKKNWYFSADGIMVYQQTMQRWRQRDCG